MLAAVLTRHEMREVEIVKGVNVMNPLRMAGMAGEAPRDNAWTLMGTFYCQRELVSGLRRIAKKAAKERGLSVRLTFSSVLLIVCMCMCM